MTITGSSLINMMPDGFSTMIPPSTCDAPMMLMLPLTVLIPPATCAPVIPILPLTLLRRPATSAPFAKVRSPLTDPALSETCEPAPRVIPPLTVFAEAAVACSPKRMLPLTVTADVTAALSSTWIEPFTVLASSAALPAGMCTEPLTLVEPSPSTCKSHPDKAKITAKAAMILCPFAVLIEALPQANCAPTVPVPPTARNLDAKSGTSSCRRGTSPNHMANAPLPGELRSHSYNRRPCAHHIFSPLPCSSFVPPLPNQCRQLPPLQIWTPSCKRPWRKNMLWVHQCWWRAAAAYFCIKDTASRTLAWIHLPRMKLSTTWSAPCCRSPESR